MTHWFHCCNKSCGEYQRDFTTAMSATDYRLATGGPIKCAFCNQSVKSGQALSPRLEPHLACDDRGNVYFIRGNVR